MKLFTALGIIGAIFLCSCSGITHKAVKITEEKPIELKPIFESKPWTELVQYTFLKSPARAFEVAASKDGEFIVYSSNEASKNKQLFMKKSDDTAPIQLTFSRGENNYPAISPDGKFIAFSSNVEGNFNIYVLRLSNPTAITQITYNDSDEIASAWSPDGKKIVYSFKLGNSWTIAISDIETRAITIIGPGEFPDWHPTKDILTFQVKRSDAKLFRIMTATIDGSEVIEVVLNNLTISNPKPKWSTNGKWIAFSAKESKSENLWLVRPDGSSLLKLTEEAGEHLSASWGKDTIFFVKSIANSHNILRLKPMPLELLETEP